MTDKGGQYLFCDTDSLCIVASKNGDMVPCGNGARIKALSRKEVDEIAERFASLNCYDKSKVTGSILKIEKVNYEGKKRIQLFGYAISAKRYCLYKYDRDGNVVIVSAKAHGLGYLYPPKDAPKSDSESDWLFEAWHWILEGAVATPRSAPDWFNYPAMMRITVSTPAVLGILKGYTRPFNFLLAPLPFRDGNSTEKKTLIVPFSTHRDQWLTTPAIDTRSGKEYPICLLGGNQDSGSHEIEVKCYGNILGEYRRHPESKSLGANGAPCDSETSGLLTRAHIISRTHRYIGKEASRKWEHGDDLSLVNFESTEYADGKLVADLETRERIKRSGIRRVGRHAELDRKTVALIANGQRVKTSTLSKLIAVLDHMK